MVIHADKVCATSGVFGKNSPFLAPEFRLQNTPNSRSIQRGEVGVKTSVFQQRVSLLEAGRKDGGRRVGLWATRTSDVIEMRHLCSDRSNTFWTKTKVDFKEGKRPLNVLMRRSKGENHCWGLFLFDFYIFVCLFVCLGNLNDSVLLAYVANTHYHSWS